MSVENGFCGASSGNLFFTMWVHQNIIDNYNTYTQNYLEYFTCTHSYPGMVSYSHNTSAQQGWKKWKFPGKLEFISRVIIFLYI